VAVSTNHLRPLARHWWKCSRGAPHFGSTAETPLALIPFLYSFTSACEKALDNKGLALEPLPGFVLDK